MDEGRVDGGKGEGRGGGREVKRLPSVAQGRERDRVLREISYPSQDSSVKSTAQEKSTGEEGRRMVVTC